MTDVHMSGVLPTVVATFQLIRKYVIESGVWVTVRRLLRHAETQPPFPICTMAKVTHKPNVAM